MLKLRVLEILKEQNRSKYSLYKGMNMSYQNFNNMVNNRTKSIQFAKIEEMCIFLGVTPNELFYYDFDKE